jgi:hypothetical protein
MNPPFKIMTTHISVKKRNVAFFCLILSCSIYRTVRRVKDLRKRVKMIEEAEHIVAHFEKHVATCRLNRKIITHPS